MPQSDLRRWPPARLRCWRSACCEQRTTAKIRSTTSRDPCPLSPGGWLFDVVLVFAGGEGTSAGHTVGIFHYKSFVANPTNDSCSEAPASEHTASEAPASTSDSGGGSLLVARSRAGALERVQPHERSWVATNSIRRPCIPQSAISALPHDDERHPAEKHHPPPRL